MPLFAGVWQRSGGPPAEGSATDLLAALHAPFHSVLSAYEDGPLVLVARSNDRPAVVSLAGTVAALSGRLDENRHAEDVLDAYLGAATSGFENLSGDYAVAVFDAGRSTLILLRDAVGTQPLYYSVGADGCFAFGSQVKAVLAATRAAPRPNRAAISRLLLDGGGVPLGQTCFADVQSLAPGQALFVTPDTISTAPYADLRPVAPPLRNFEESAAAFRQQFQQSVSRRLQRNSPTAIFLSGGLDSAAIAATAAANGDVRQLIAISYGMSDGSAADERPYVEAVVRRVRMRSIWLDLLPLDFPQRAERDVWASETPLIDDMPGPLVRAAEAARAEGAHDLMLGVWGDDVLFPFPPPLFVDLLRHGHFLQYRRYAGAVASWLADVSRADLRSALAKQALRAFVPAHALDLVRPVRGLAAHFDELAPLTRRKRAPTLSYAGAVRNAITAPASVTALETVTKWGWANGLKTHLPFTDANLIQLLCATPAAHALHGGVPKALLRKAVVDLVPTSVLERRDKGDYTAVWLAQLNQQRQECLEQLQGAELLVKHRLMSRRAADAALAKIKAGVEIGSEAGALLTGMVGANAWLRVFFESSTEARHEERTEIPAHS